jgi:SAM-dependent methyltransferase
LAELWLQAGLGPAADEIAQRVAWWQAREGAFLSHAPEGLRRADDPRSRPAHARALIERYLPLASVRGDVHHLLRLWFGPGLDALGVDLDTSCLGRARSWLDAPYDLPTQLLARTHTCTQAHALLFELFSSPRLGASLERYPQRRARLAEWATQREQVTLWDVGCATGESSWALALALAQGGARVEGLGTTPWPLERLMAERGGFPHDAQRTAALQRFLADVPARVSLRFADHDLESDPPPGEFDVVACHGVLGEAVPAGCVARIAKAVRPGGLLSVTSDFRADRHTLGLSGLTALDEELWEQVGEGLLRRR